MSEVRDGMDLSITRLAWVAFAEAPGDAERTAILEECVIRAVDFTFGDGVDANRHILDLGTGIGG